MSATPGHWMGGILGQAFSHGTELELGAGVNFLGALSASFNATTGLVDVTSSADFAAPTAGDEGRLAWAHDEALAWASQLYTDGTYLGIGDAAAIAQSSGDLRGDDELSAVGRDGSGHDLSVFALDGSGGIDWGQDTY